MPRRKRLRKVVAPPGFKGYRPYGATPRTIPPVDLLYEEYEALKLADYDMLNHLEASRLMGISRPTFARIYESARRKLAKALVEMREIKTVFGNVVLHGTWFLCNSCNDRFPIHQEQSPDACPTCNSTGLEQINIERR